MITLVAPEADACEDDDELDELIEALGGRSRLKVPLFGAAARSCLGSGGARQRLVS